MNYYNASGKTATDLRYELDLLKEKKLQQDIDNAKKEVYRKADETDKARLRADQELKHKYERKASKSS
ncbi:MAG TPA: hypothetical protein ACHBX0_12470 [Arsenophonus sp.]